MSACSDVSLAIVAVRGLLGQVWLSVDVTLKRWWRSEVDGEKSGVLEQWHRARAEAGGTHHWHSSTHRLVPTKKVIMPKQNTLWLDALSTSVTKLQLISCSQLVHVPLVTHLGVCQYVRWHHPWVAHLPQFVLFVGWLELHLVQYLFGALDGQVIDRSIALHNHLSTRLVISHVIWITRLLSVLISHCRSRAKHSRLYRLFLFSILCQSLFI